MNDLPPACPSRGPVPYYVQTPPDPGPCPGIASFCFVRPEDSMIRALRAKLGKEIEELSFELTVTLPKAIATAVEMGDLRENSEYKAALERQQLVQARLSQ